MVQPSNPAPVPGGKLQLRFEPSYLADACLVEAYRRLVPVARRPLSKSLRWQGSATVVPLAKEDEPQVQAEGGPPCR